MRGGAHTTNQRESERAACGQQQTGISTKQKEAKKTERTVQTKSIIALASLRRVSIESLSSFVCRGAAAPPRLDSLHFSQFSLYSTHTIQPHILIPSTRTTREPSLLWATPGGRDPLPPASLLFNDRRH